MTDTSIRQASAAEEGLKPHRSLWYDVWAQFRTHRGALPYGNIALERITTLGTSMIICICSAIFFMASASIAALNAGCRWK